VSEQATTGVKILDRVEPLVFEWERLAESVGASPFLWPGWFQAWWRAFGRGALRIIAVYEEGALTGILPLRRSIGALVSPTNYHTPLFGPLGEDERALERLSRAMFSERTRQVELSFLAPADAGSHAVREAAEASRYRMLDRTVQMAPYVDTCGPWEDYEGGLRSKFRGELRRRRRRLQEEGELRLEVHDGSHRLEELLEEGFRVEGSGWKEVRGTSIASHPVTRGFYTEVARWAAGRGWLRLAFLRLDGRPIAFDYCLEHDGMSYLLKTGYDPVYRRLAPGMVIRHLMLERAFFDEICTYEFLGADYGWKREWSNTQRERLFLRMFAPTVPGALDRAAVTHGRPAAKQVKDFAQSALSRVRNDFRHRSSESK
jgi:CelD/BcsL family acetyltransferase involved in cellulose biosynthesis